MTSLLDNELVKKYFCKNCGPDQGHSGKHWVDAADVLSAMQEPIRKGDLYLGLETNDVGPASFDFAKFHPYALRLPDKFQKRECEHHVVCRCGAKHCLHELNLPQRDEVEEICGIKIKLDPNLKPGEWYICKAPK